MNRNHPHITQNKQFSRQWWFGGLRDLSFVAVVTFLIWIYSDMTVTEEADFRATIVLTTESDPDMVLLSSPRVEVIFKLAGTRRGLVDYRRRLEERRSEIVGDVARGYVPGQYNLAAEDLLRGANGPSMEGLTVLSASPGKIPVQLDRLVRQRAKVQLDSVGATFSEPPKIQPAEVLVILAQQDQQAIPEDPNSAGTLTLKTRPLDLSNAPTGEPVSRQVEVLPPATTHSTVRLEPKTVLVTVKIDQRTDSQPVTINVQAMGPSAWAEPDGTWSDYRLVKKDPLEWRRQITVKGARKDLEKLRPEDVQAYAMLGEDDKNPVESWLSRPVTVRFPIGMDLQIVGEPPTVHFRLEKRTAPAAPTP